MIPARVVLDRHPPAEPELEVSPPAPVARESWRERLWSCPAETRLGLEELCKALDRSASWIYHRTTPKAEHRLPHRKLDGVLCFTAGEVRAWIRDREEVMHAGRMESPRLQAVGGGR